MMMNSVVTLIVTLIVTEVKPKVNPITSLTGTLAIRSSSPWLRNTGQAPAINRLEL